MKARRGRAAGDGGAAEIPGFDGSHIREVLDKVDASPNGHHEPEAEVVLREPVALEATGAVISILSQSLQSSAARIALGAFCEGRGLEGQWRLEITGARLVPEEATPKA